MNTSLKNKNGFTLVETLVAIAILLLAIVGPMTVAQKGMQNAQFASEQITAVFLAQEAIEAVRQARDERALSAYKSNTNIGGTNNWAPTCTGGCAYNQTQNEFIPCSSADGCRLHVNSTTGLYTYTLSDPQSIFTRTVTIGGVNNGGRPVTVDVSWKGKIFGGANRHAILQTWIYDHYQRYDE